MSQAWANPQLWHGLDFETTSQFPTEARIVTASAATLSDEYHGAAEWLADPEIEIPAEATAIHKITTEHARQHGRELCYVTIEIAEWVARIWDKGAPVVIYNAPYDLGVLHHSLIRHADMPRGLLTFGPIGPAIDPLVIDKYVDRYRKGSRKLSATCEHYGITLQDAHTSTGDAIAAVRLTQVILKRYPEIAEIPLAQLQDCQSHWYFEQQISFARYLRSTVASKAPVDERDAIRKRADDVEDHADGWPIKLTHIPMPEDDPTSGHDDWGNS